MAFGNKSSKAVRERETESLMGGLKDALASTSNRDTIIRADLGRIDPDPENGRLGQEELLLALPEIIEQVRVVGKDHVPLYDELGKPPVISNTAKRLYDGCARQANTFIDAGGAADSPPKVLPANKQGRHKIKYGHRRYISAMLAAPITGFNAIDVILDKADEAEDTLYQAMGRVVENSSREDNTLAENILLMATVVVKVQAKGQKVNKSDLARKLGIERTRLSRLVDIVERGGAEDVQLLTYMHEHNVEDLTAVSLVFRAPREQWRALVEELAEVGPSSFRAKYTQTAAGKSVAVPHSDAAASGTSVSEADDTQAPAPAAPSTAAGSRKPRAARAPTNTGADIHSPALRAGVVRLLELLPGDMATQADDPAEQLIEIITRLAKEGK